MRIEFFIQAMDEAARLSEAEGVKGTHEITVTIAAPSDHYTVPLDQIKYSTKNTGVILDVTKTYIDLDAITVIKLGTREKQPS